VGVAALAIGLFFALAPIGKTGAKYDAEAHRIEASGAAAADPRAPNADVARVKAERNARVDAAAKIRRGLVSLGWHGDDAAFETLITAATATPDYGGDGSVTLVLSVSTEGLVLRSGK
jgi:hypothetical protein